MLLSEFCRQACGDPCRTVFDRVAIRLYTSGGTLIMWQLMPQFDAPGPLRFQVQVGRTNNPLADDWVDVGLPVIDQFYAIDPEQRDWGKRKYTHYRVVLEAGDGNTYYSLPTAGLGTLNRREWLLARELLRQRLKLYRKGYAAQEGFLLKRRKSGQPCPSCLDLQTEEPRNPDCPYCYGTGYRCGYYYPISCVFALFEPQKLYLRQDQRRGTVNDQRRVADMLLADMAETEDVFVALRTDDRYWIHAIAATTEVRGIMIAGQVELRLIPFSSPIYSIPVQDTLEVWNRLLPW